jgi:hypothetical protein
MHHLTGSVADQDRPAGERGTGIVLQVDCKQLRVLARVPIGLKLAAAEVVEGLVVADQVEKIVLHCTSAFQRQDGL